MTTAGNSRTKTQEFLFWMRSRLCDVNTAKSYICVQNVQF